jgi:hypothetical protein
VPGGDRELRDWARRATRLRAVPVDDEALSAIGALGTQAAIRRMDSGTTPEGTPFKPLSRRYSQWKQRKRGQTKFWQLTGESKRKLRAGGGHVVRRGVVTAIRWIINTPWSGAVHDGATIHRTSKRHSVATRQRLQAMGARRTKQHEKRLRTLYGESGRGATQRAYEKHNDALREARNARRRGAAELLPQYRRSSPNAPTSVRAALASMLGAGGKSVTIKIPARPVLGFSDKDKRALGRILAASAKRRMEGGNG